MCPHYVIGINSRKTSSTPPSKTDTRSDRLDLENARQSMDWSGEHYPSFSKMTNRLRYRTLSLSPLTLSLPLHISLPSLSISLPLSLSLSLPYPFSFSLSLSLSTLHWLHCRWVLGSAHIAADASEFWGWAGRETSRRFFKSTRNFIEEQRLKRFNVIQAQWSFFISFLLSFFCQEWNMWAQLIGNN